VVIRPQTAVFLGFQGRRARSFMCWLVSPQQEFGFTSGFG